MMGERTYHIISIALIVLLVVILNLFYNFPHLHCVFVFLSVHIHIHVCACVSRVGCVLLCMSLQRPEDKVGSFAYSLSSMLL